MVAQVLPQESLQEELTGERQLAVTRLDKQMLPQVLPQWIAGPAGDA